jgi:hypothetical protein
LCPFQHLRTKIYNFNPYFTWFLYNVNGINQFLWVTQSCLNTKIHLLYWWQGRLGKETYTNQMTNISWNSIFTLKIQHIYGISKILKCIFEALVTVCHKILLYLKFVLKCNIVIIILSSCRKLKMKYFSNTIWYLY